LRPEGFNHIPQHVRPCPLPITCAFRAICTPPFSLQLRRTCRKG
jgi:hypothetical protein